MLSRCAVVFFCTRFLHFRAMSGNAADDPTLLGGLFLTSPPFFVFELNPVSSAAAIISYTPSLFF